MSKNKTLEIKDKDFKLLIKTLGFYADPGTYFGIAFYVDPPHGDFYFDFSNTHLGKKPGKMARKTLEKLCGIDE